MSLVPVVAALVVVPFVLGFYSTADSPQDPSTYHACYIPHSGVVYRIMESDLPDGCRSGNHVQFSWNASGPEGPEGPEGPAGPPGADGLHCWDLDGDGTADPGEDINGDGVFDALDCSGPPGPPGTATDAWAELELVTESDFVTIPAGSSEAVYRYINCPIGKMAINGGPFSQPRGDLEVSIITNHPVSGGDPLDKPRRWLVGFLVHNRGASDGSLELQGSALCVPY
jgi:hypothetical protein